MKKENRPQYPNGVTIAKKLTSKDIKTKYKDNPYVTKGRETWGETLDNTFPMSNGSVKIKDAIIKAGTQVGINPALLYTSAMEEGMNQAIIDPNSTSEAYAAWSKKNSKLAGQYKVDGFYNYGLDRFGENYQGLIDKGYLPKDFTNRFTPYEALNEKKEKIKTAAFATDQDALIAKAAMIRDTQDRLSTYEKAQNLKFSDKQRDFFTLAGYNGGIGNMQKMISSYNEKGYLKDDKFLDPSFKPASYGSIYTNVQRRLQNKNVLENEGYFALGGEVGPEDPEELKNVKNTGIDIFQNIQQQNPLHPDNTKEQQIFRVDQKGNVSQQPDIIPLSQYYDVVDGKNGNKQLEGTGKYVNNDGETTTPEAQQTLADKVSADNLMTSNKRDETKNQVEMLASTGMTALNSFLGKNQANKENRKNNRKSIMDELFTPSINPYLEGTGSQAIMKNGGSLEGDNQLQITDGGKTKTLSNSDHSNPMIEFVGKEHKEGGIGIQYGQKIAEVENKEVGFIDQEGGLNIFGKLKLPGTNKTFRNVAKDIAKEESKVDRTKEKYLTILNKANVADTYQQSAISTAKVMFQSLDNQSKQIVEKKEALASYQNIILGLLDSNSDKMEYGGRVMANGGTVPGDEEDIQKIAKAIAAIESSGDYKIKGPQVTKGRYKGQKALGKYQIMPGNLKEWSKEALGKEVTEEEFLNSEALQDKIATFQMKKIYSKHNNAQDVASVWFTGRPTSAGGSAKDDLGTTGNVYVKKFLSHYGSGNGYAATNTPTQTTKTTQTNTVTTNDFQPKYAPITEIDPSVDTQYGKANKNPTTFSDKVNIGSGGRERGFLSPLALEQIAPELLTIATNKQEPVFRQSYQPELKQTFDLSYQLGRNENQSSFNQVAKIAEQTGNIDALSQLAAQKYKADEAYNMQEIQGNATQKLGVYGQNVDVLNDARIKNLALIADQQNRQAQAQFNTRKEGMAAFTSISGKVLQNNLENKTYNAYANLFKHYGFDKKGNVTFNPDNVVQKFNEGEAQQFGLMAAQQGVDKIIKKTSKDGTESKTEINNSDLDDIIKAREAMKKGASYADIIESMPHLGKYKSLSQQ